MKKISLTKNNKITLGVLALALIAVGAYYFFFLRGAESQTPQQTVDPQVTEELLTILDKLNARFF